MPEYSEIEIWKKSFLGILKISIIMLAFLIFFTWDIFFKWDQDSFKIKILLLAPYGFLYLVSLWTWILAKIRDKQRNKNR